jgi:4-hydroxythreonine-4-phosphate dehydrogenase
LRPSLSLHVTLGDPTGIGPEVVVAALNGWSGPQPIIHGHRAVLERAARLRGVTLPEVELREPVGIADPFAAPGETQLAQLEAAAAAARRGEVDALVTGPIQKQTIARAGFAFPGHTEFLGAAAGVPLVAMLFAGPTLRVLLLTVHVPLAEVPGALTVAGIRDHLLLGISALETDFGVPAPRVVVCGVNPHAGEAGRFGDEEQRVIAPALAEARARLAARGSGATVVGPWPADAVFRQAARGAYDLVLAAYHDQALIPVKLLEFERTVNVTLGLPYVRTSPPHGTAHDIAWTGRADPSGCRAALELACALAERRRAAAG